MRNLEQLQERRAWYEDRILEMTESDAAFSDDPVHAKDISAFQSALKYLISRIRKFTDE